MHYLPGSRQPNGVKLTVKTMNLTRLSVQQFKFITEVEQMCPYFIVTVLFAVVIKFAAICCGYWVDTGTVWVADKKRSRRIALINDSHFRNLMKQRSAFSVFGLPPIHTSGSQVWCVSQYPSPLTVYHKDTYWLRAASQLDLPIGQRTKCVTPLSCAFLIPGVPAWTSFLYSCFTLSYRQLFQWL